MDYAYGTADIEVAEDGRIVGRLELRDDGSVTYADIDSKAAVKLNEDGSCLLKFILTAYTSYLYEDVRYCEGTFIVDAVVDESGKLALKWEDPKSYIDGTLQKRN